MEREGLKTVVMAMRFETGVMLIMRLVLVETIIKSKHRAASKMANCCSF